MIRAVFMALSMVTASWALAEEPTPAKEQTTESLEPAVNTSAPPAKETPAAGKKALDRLELDTTQITGNRELPKVLYIVPWKRADLGDLLGRPVNSLLDEVLAPVDRDVFKRETRYYRALKPDAAAATPTSAPAPKPASAE